jgi:hypothetical protein
MADNAGNDSWEYRRLNLVDGQVMEEGEQLPTQTLKGRSLELINDGWEPIEASETHRLYRRAPSGSAGDLGGSMPGLR